VVMGIGMAIDNEMYSRQDFGWWDSDPNSTNVLLRYFINPIRYGYFVEILNQRCCGDAPGRSLLDVGCGGGYLCEEFAKYGFEVTGLDPSQNTLKAARGHAAETHVSIEYQEGKAEKLPFGDSSFDYVSCCDVLEHVDSLSQTVAEIARVLKPGGLFFYDTINRTFISWLAVIKIAQDWKSTAWEAPNTHEWRRFVKISELSSMMKNNGLTMQENKGIGPSSGLRSFKEAVRQRARGRITRYEMARRFGFEKNDNLSASYMGYAVKS
jgi:2-polyprenyl-6-hydroxyphenyl methylase / 3-demethylubiquinone-9 3-methyltransferase